jgi:hypothetical protein
VRTKQPIDLDCELDTIAWIAPEPLLFDFLDRQVQDSAGDPKHLMDG